LALHPDDPLRAPDFSGLPAAVLHRDGHVPRAAPRILTATDPTSPK
jgi:hypothetical protein